MKKHLIITLSILLASVSIQAQETKVGIKGGWNYSNLSGDIVGLLNFNGDYTSGYHAGAFASFGLTENFAVQPELLFNRYGTVQSVPGINTDAGINLSYLSLPVLAKYYLTDGFAIMAGPQLSYLIDSNLDIAMGNNDLTTEFINIYNDIDFGVNVGAAYEFPFGMVLGANYYHGLTNVADIPLVDVGNRSFQLSLGWILTQ